jgi:hypothetical protein
MAILLCIGSMGNICTTMEAFTEAEGAKLKFTYSGENKTKNPFSLQAFYSWLLFRREYRYSMKATNSDEEPVPNITNVAESNVSLPSLFFMQ